MATPRLITEAEANQDEQNPNATLTLHSSGDATDTSTFTADNSGVKQIDINAVEMFRLWAGGIADADGSLYIGDSLPAGFPTSQDNVVLGFGAMLNVTVDASRNLAIGTGAVGSTFDGNPMTGSSNVGIGYHAGQSIEDGGDNVAIGDTTDVLAPSGNGITLIGSQTDSAVGVTENGIGIGYLVTVETSNTAVIGNASVTDAYFGSVTGASILHGKANALIFPDSDPHVAGAAYWVAGVLTKSAG